MSRCLNLFDFVQVLVAVVWLATNVIKSYLQPGLLSEILTIWNLLNAASRIWTYPEPKFSLCWIKLWSSDNHYTTASLSILYPMLKGAKFKVIANIFCFFVCACPYINHYEFFCEIIIEKKGCSNCATYSEIK